MALLCSARTADRGRGIQFDVWTLRCVARGGLAASSGTGTVPRASLDYNFSTKNTRGMGWDWRVAAMTMTMTMTMTID